jgi:hypothetical protein
VSVTFNPRALIATVAFATTVALACYADSRKWAIAPALVWLLSVGIERHFRDKRFSDRP